jgi:membrane protein YqaA with SNARE-associated domain
VNLLSYFLSWWGAFVLGALDSSLVFFLPLGIDTLVIYLAARNEDLFWLYPLLATAGSMTGAAWTYWVGRTAGEAGLERFVPKRRLERLRRRVRERGAIAFALPALLPPPFPLTPFILTCGALQVDWRRFFLTFGIARLARFFVEAVLARLYGRGILRVMQSDGFQMVIIGLIVLAVVGTAVSGAMLWRSTRRPRAATA